MKHHDVDVIRLQPMQARVDPGLETRHGSSGGINLV